MLMKGTEDFRWYMWFYVVGITQFEIFHILYPTNKSIDIFGTVRMLSTLLESFPSGALQLYVLLLEKKYQNLNLNLISVVISGLSGGSGIQNYFSNGKSYKEQFIVFTFVSSDFFIRTIAISYCLVIYPETKHYLVPGIWFIGLIFTAWFEIRKSGTRDLLSI
eukprot:UN27430